MEKEAASKAKNAEKEKEFKETKENLMDGMKEDIGKGLDHLKKLTNKRQSELLEHCCEVGKIPNKKASLVKALSEELNKQSDMEVEAESDMEVEVESDIEGEAESDMEVEVENNNSEN